MFVDIASVFNAAWHVVRHVASEKHWMASLFVVTDFVVAVALVTCAVYKTIRLVQMSRVRTTAACLRDFLAQQQVIEDMMYMQDVEMLENLNVTDKKKFKEEIKIREEIENRESINAQELTELQKHLKMKAKRTGKENLKVLENLQKKEVLSIQEDIGAMYFPMKAEKKKIIDCVNINSNAKMQDVARAKAYGLMQEQLNTEEKMKLIENVTMLDRHELEALNTIDDACVKKYLEVEEEIKLIESVKITEDSLRQDIVNMKDNAEKWEFLKIVKKLNEMEEIKLTEHLQAQELIYTENYTDTLKVFCLEENMTTMENEKMTEDSQLQETAKRKEICAIQEFMRVKEKVRLMAGIKAVDIIQKQEYVSDLNEMCMKQYLKMKEKIENMGNVNTTVSMQEEESKKILNITNVQEDLTRLEKVKFMEDPNKTEMTHPQESGFIWEDVNMGNVPKVYANIKFMETVSRLAGSEVRNVIRTRGTKYKQKYSTTTEKVKLMEDPNMTEITHPQEFGYMWQDVSMENVPTVNAKMKLTETVKRFGDSEKRNIVEKRDEKHRQNYLTTAEKIKFAEDFKIIENLQERQIFKINRPTLVDEQECKVMNENKRLMESVRIIGALQMQELLSMQNDGYTYVDHDMKENMKLMEDMKSSGSLKFKGAVVRQHEIKQENLLKEIEMSKGKEKGKTQGTIQLILGEVMTEKPPKGETPEKDLEMGEDSTTIPVSKDTVSEDDSGIPQKVKKESEKSGVTDHSNLETVTTETHRLLIESLGRDGNSLFGVVAQKIFKAPPGSKEYVRCTNMMRRVINRLLSTNKRDYRKYLLEDIGLHPGRYKHLETFDEKIESYLNDMKKDGFAVGTAAVLAVADYFGVNMVVYAEPKGRTVFESSQEKITEEVNILQRTSTNEDGETVYHFDSVVQVTPFEKSD